METAITSIGTATPLYRQHQLKAAQMVTAALQLRPAEKRLLKSIYQSTGIDYRHSVIPDFCKEQGEYEFFPNDPTLPFPTTAARMQVYKANALPLALAAIKNCFMGLSTLNRQDITHLITVSCTGMYAPGLDIDIARELQLSANVQRTCINFMGCYGVFNAIKMADALCRAYPQAKVLIVSVELCTIHFQKNDSMDSIFSNAIFADGAAAVLIEAQPNQQKSFSLEAFHCDLLPGHSHDMTWHIGDYGFDIVLSSYVPQAIQASIAEFTARLLQQQQMQLADVNLYAIHPGGHKILKACEAALGLDEEANRYAYDVLRQYGNMSSATVLFVLKAIWDEISTAHTQQKIFSCAFGPGLTLEAMLLRIS